MFFMIFLCFFFLGPSQTVAHIANLSAAVMGYGKTRKTDSEFVA